MSTLRGQLIAITGGASGIGRATSELLAKNGAILSIADMDGKAVEHFAKELTDNGATVFWKEVDVRNRDEAEAWVGDTVKHFNRPLDGNYRRIRVWRIEKMTVRRRRQSCGYRWASGYRARSRSDRLRRRLCR